MTSSYTSNTGIEKPATGDQSGAWGDTVNVNMDIIDRVLNGVGAISLSGTTHTLTTSDGTLSDGMYRVLVLGGSPSGTNTITVSPNDQDKVFFAKNGSGQSVVFSQGSGANVTIANGDTKIIYCDGAGSGAAVVDFTNDLSMSSVSITGGSVTGITDLAVADGGTGASNAAAARAALSAASLGANSDITSITGLTTDLTVAQGGTGASDAAAARSNLSAAALGANTFTGTQSFADNIASRPLFQDYGEIVNAIGGTGGGTQAIDLTLGNVVSATVDTSANTFTFTNPTATGKNCGFILYLTNGGSQTVAWPAAVDYPGGTAPTLTASGVDILVFNTTDAGTRWYGNLVGAAYA